MISVVIPTYNRENTILESVNSVLKQTYTDTEVIVVDDCSTDNTIEILKGISDSRLKIIKMDKNSGAGAARNEGIRIATGEYLSFHDSDDICRPDKLQAQLNVLLENRADITFCALNRHNYGTDGKFPDINSGFKDFKDILMGFYVSTQTIMGKREIFLEDGFDEKLKRLQDYDLMVRVAQKHKVYYDDRVLVDVFLQNDSLTLLLKNYQMMNSTYKYILEKYSDIAHEYPEWKTGMLRRIVYTNAMLKTKSSRELKELYNIDNRIEYRTMMFADKMGLLKILYDIKSCLRGA